MEKPRSGSPDAHAGLLFEEALQGEADEVLLGQLRLEIIMEPEDRSQRPRQLVRIESYGLAGVEGDLVAGRLLRPKQHLLPQSVQVEAGP